MLAEKEKTFIRLDSESGIIASLIHNPELVFYSEELKESHFTNSDNQCIYTAIQTLAHRGIKTVDAFNILEILNSEESTRSKASKLTIERLNELVELSTIIARHTPEEYKVLVDNVLDAAFRRDAYACLERCRGFCLDGEIDNVESAIYDEIDRVMTDYIGASEMPLYKDIVDEAWEHVKARSRGDTNAISFPFRDLNKYVVMEPGECVCFTGGAKAGKSAMLLTCTVDMLRKNKSVLYIDSEISSELFTIRIISHLTQIKFGVIRSGKFTQEEEEKINEAIAWLKTRKFIHIYMPILTADALYVAAKKAKHLIDINCIVVDYLKADSGKDQAFEVYASLGNVSDTLKNKIAGELKICALTAAQATATGKIADSSRIARSMSTVIAIQDKDPIEAAEDGTGATKKLRVVFNRNGPQMTTDDEWIDMEFYGDRCCYEQCRLQHQKTEPF